jgi:hypothetical protein
LRADERKGAEVKRAVVVLTVLLPAFIGWSAPARAEITVAGSLSNQTRVRLLQEDMPKEYDWDVTTMLTRLDVIGRARNQEQTARLFVDLDFREDPTGVFQETDGYEWRLREAYGGFYTSYASFEIGKRIYSWGVTDEFNPTDVLDPEDMRWMFTLDKPDRKLGVYSANVTLSYDSFAWQTVVEPVFEPTLVPARASDWLPWELQLFYSLVDAFPDFVEFEERRVPATKIQNASAASRFSGTLGPVDFTAVWFDGFDPLPVYNVDISIDANAVLGGGKPLRMVERYQRYQAYGGSLAFTLGKFAFRGEGAYYTPRLYNTRPDPELLKVDNILQGYQTLLQLADFKWQVKSPSYSVVGGFDWRSGTQFYCNFQYVHQQILDYDPRTIYHEYEGIVTGKAMAKFFEDDFEVGVNGAYNVYHADWYVKPYVAYNFTPDFRLETGTAWFSGEPETRFGEYDDNDYGYVQARYAF